MKKRILWITNLPASYKVSVFNELGKETELTVLFERRQARNRPRLWNAAASEKNYREIWLKGINIGDEMSLSLGFLPYLRRDRYDLILLNGYSSPTAMLAIQYMKIKKIPFALICDGMLQNPSAGIREAVKRYLIQCASFYISSGKLTDEVLRSYGAAQDRIFRYPFSSVSEDALAVVPYDRQPYKDIIGCRSRYMILYVGQMIYRKGIDILQRAVKGLDADYTLYLIGGTQSDLLIPDENTRVLDFMDSQTLADYYKAADLFVLPTREDIWGLVVNEALAYGVPVISTDRCGAAADLIEDGVNGAVVPVEDVAALEGKIRAYLNCGDKTKMMENAVATARHYTIETMTKGILRIINDCC